MSRRLPHLPVPLFHACRDPVLEDVLEVVGQLRVKPRLNPGEVAQSFVVTGLGIEVVVPQCQFSGRDKVALEFPGKRTKTGQSENKTQINAKGCRRRGGRIFQPLKP